MSIDNDVIKTPITVLCVDDELNILKSIKRLLYKQNYQLLLAESAEKGLELMQQHNVHLIISDMKMPVMSGAQLLEKVSVSYPDTYRILLTGYSNMESTNDAVNIGKIHCYLQKPWGNQEIINAIDEGLENVRLKQRMINQTKTY
jgi:response regulator RpfG family c-di-GMP phosphodiesterase